MAVRWFRLTLDPAFRRRTLLGLGALNLALAATTALFIILWRHLPSLDPAGSWWVRRVLVQGHLGTENVLAAWYSSMLMLGVAVLAVLAWRADRTRLEGFRSVGWLFVAGAFTALSLDELGSIHERIGMIRTSLAVGAKAGWVGVLAVPALLVAAGMVAFAWTTVRRVAGAFPLLAAGVTLLLSGLGFEEIEMRLLDSPAASSRGVHDVLMVLEEAGLELFGTLLSLAAVMRYLSATVGERSVWPASDRGTILVVRGLTLAGILGVLGSRWLVDALPKGDTGLPQHWFPAVLWLLVALISTRRSAGYGLADRMWSGTAVALSGVMGAGLYAYVPALGHLMAWQVPLAAVVLAGIALEIRARRGRLTAGLPGPERSSARRLPPGRLGLT